MFALLVGWARAWVSLPLVLLLFFGWVSALGWANLTWMPRGFLQVLAFSALWFELAEIYLGASASSEDILREDEAGLAGALGGGLGGLGLWFATGWALSLPLASLLGSFLASWAGSGGIRRAFQATVLLPLQGGRAGLFTIALFLFSLTLGLFSR